MQDYARLGYVAPLPIIPEAEAVRPPLSRPAATSPE